MKECTEQRFLKDVAKHQMIVFADNGINRHIRFKAPCTTNMQFDLITWDRHLCYTGDMGTYVFERLADMFCFFRQLPEKREGIHINTGYWAEKCIATDRYSGISEYSHEKAKETIIGILDDAMVSEDIRDAVEENIFDCLEDESLLRAAVDRFDEFYFSDFWEENLHVRPFRYVWCCYAIAWGILYYDKAKAAVTA